MRYIIGLLLCLSFSQLSYGVENKQTDNETWVYMMANGDSLWNISSKFLKKIDYYSDLQKLNNISYPKRLQPGTIIRIPMQWIKKSPASAKVTFQEGTNEYRRNKVLLPLTNNTQLILGDEIRIGANSSATVVFADGSEMILFKNTIVSFDHLTSYGKTGMVDTRVRVIQGKVETNAQKNKGPGSRLDISTPSAISSVRGTQYRVSNSTNDISTVEVIEGKVSVAGEKENDKVNVNAGQGTRIKKGEKPLPPVTLLTSPQVVNHKVLFESAPLISWLPVSGAKEYNIQLSQSPNFQSILWQQIHTPPSITLPTTIPDGVVYYRITAIDELGIEGFPGKGQFKLNLLPLAPKKNITPVRINNQKDSAQLSWSNNNNKSAKHEYLVEISNNETFNNIIIKEKTQELFFPLPDTLAFGRYHWRVSTIIDTDKGPASNSSAFNWKTEVKQPNCFIDESSKNISISWSILEKNQHINIQISEDSQFTEILKEFNVDQKAKNVNYTLNDEVFVRCKVTIPNTDISSKWSDVQHISQIDKGIMSIFGFIILIILI